MRGAFLVRQAAALGLLLCVSALPAACARPQARLQATAPATAAAPTVTRRPGPATKGQEAPDFSFQTTDGKTVRLSDYRGKVVLVNLWATWCGPCRMEVPDLVAAYNRYAPRGFTVLAVNQGEERDLVAAFAGQFGIEFPVLLDQDGRIRTNYPYRGIPTSFIVDRNGIVREIWMGNISEEAIKQLVEPLLDA
ncbi:MAG TPA: TlpA disulfide reductase family protein [Anaerolineae bacterium]|nr:TlpA disulfide reductase family protein [Anaerolineae bacterium]HOQ99990.1 TlpA disulfide reductase family protein [Anaerolineae bacterium]HPL30042.1 TlpA disulfide reductase family protein [Anaerolineae bacterium]